ncbi:MAG: 7-cyano-7-deazaguanine synthase [Thermoplasmata archaeon]
MARNGGGMCVIDVDFIATKKSRADSTGRFNIMPNYRRLILDAGSEREVKAEFTASNSEFLKDISQDLLDVATAIFYADQAVTKSAFSHRRRLGTVIPVRKLSLWKPLEDDHSRICTFLDENVFNVYFCDQSSVKPSHTIAEEPLYGDIVCLFSGGLDSLAGAINALEKGRSPILVGTSHSAPMTGVQQRLFDALKSDYQDARLTRFKVFVSRSRQTSDPHRYRRRTTGVQSCRSFLYISAAAVMANEIGIDHVVVPENAILALNIPLSPGRVNTRTVHPLFIEMYRKLAGRVLAKPIEIDNPFWYQTKSEVVTSIRRHPEYITLTASCWQLSYARTVSKRFGRAANHCGYCHPCIMRRIALISAGLGSYDVDYAIDLFHDLGGNFTNDQMSFIRELKINLAHLLRFVNRFLTSSEDDRNLLVSYSGLPQWYDTEKSIATHIRFCNEVLDVFKKHGNTQLQDMVEASGL